jgi:hypothetical protein|uniref:Uncharacterized protein n=2 Tax=Picea TaxID=3328 RepID=A0A124GNE2_PICGL|nr:hypothetical protein ABT39_MTgene4543 [Picea glauca]QHR92731.1 hypothetical protein Q903MT_gene6779 [Picea sitchensis]
MSRSRSPESLTDLGWVLSDRLVSAPLRYHLKAPSSRAALSRPRHLSRTLGDGSCVFPRGMLYDWDQMNSTNKGCSRRYQEGLLEV